MPRLPFLSRSFVLLRVRGFEIAVHATWPVMVALLALVGPYEGRTSLGTRLGVALLFYVFVLLHELAHTVVAFAWRLEPKRIVLFMFGGVSQIARPAAEPRQEFHVAIAGPLASLILAGALAAVASALHPGEPLWRAGLWGFFALLNLLLAGFNMLPGFPLDGGRVLRSGLWAVLGDHARATRLAAGAGKALAGGLMAGGVAFVLLSFGTLEGAAPTGIWYVVLGWILYSIAGAAGRQEGAIASAAPVPPAPAPPAVRVTPPGTPATLRAEVVRRKRPVVSGGPISTRKPRAPARRRSAAIPAKKAHEGKAQKPDAPRRGAGRAHGARPAAQARDQSRDGSRHSGTRSAHARGGARRAR